MEKEVLRKKKLLDSKKEYASALTYIGMYHSQACWRSEEDVARQFVKITSNTARVNAVKDHIRIRDIAFGWNDVHIALSKNGRYFTGEKLRNKFIDIVISFESKRDTLLSPK